MESVLELFKKYSSNIFNIKKYEDFDTYTLSFEITEVRCKLEWNDMIFISSFISIRDSLAFTITVNEGEPFSFNPTDSSELKQSILDDINKLIENECVIQIKYTVSKRRRNSLLSIYDLGLYYEYLCSLKLQHLFNILQKYLVMTYLNKFEVQNKETDEVFFHSSLLLFATKSRIETINSIPDSEQRESILKYRRLNTSPQSFAKYNFIPNDFNDLSGTSSDPYNIIKFFNKLKIALAASFISNNSDIKGFKEVQVAIIGHKYIESTIDFSQLNNIEAQNFYSIYEWIYDKGEIHDKLDLSRNIISRYFLVREYKWILPIDTLNSIQSAHSIYLKENVEKYIETKNKVAELTTEMSVKSKDNTDYFISSFKNNNLTILTYFISIFIFNSLSDNSDKKVFSIEKYYLSMSFLFISCLYLIFTIRQLRRDLRINVRYFYSMKRIYQDIFDKQELNYLFHKRHLQYNIKNVRQTINLFSTLWLVEIVLLSIISIVFTFFVK
jgi:hypothetical protein